MRILHGRQLAEEIRAMLEVEGTRCAVAFWGPEMALNARESGARVILDISMNCTSRRALKALGVRKRLPKSVASRISVLDGLHAKIFLGEDHAIVGSANASGNALGHAGGSPSLREAGVRIDRSTEPEAFEEVEAVWRSYLAAARPVRGDDLDRAARLPVSVAARDHVPFPSDRPGSVLDDLLKRPDAFAGTVFVFADHPAKKREIREAEDAYEAEHGTAPRTDGRQHVCTINDPECDSRLRRAALHLCWWFGEDPGLYAYHDLTRVEHGASISYFGRMRWPTVRKAFGMPIVTRERAWRADEGEAKRLLREDGRRKGKRFVLMAHDELYEALQRDDDRD